MTVTIPDPFEPNDNFASATPIDDGAQVQGAYINRTARDQDVYKWIAPKTGPASVDLVFDQSRANLDLYFYDSRGSLVGKSASLNADENVSTFVQKNATYYIRVVGDWAPGGGGHECESKDVCSYTPPYPSTARYNLATSPQSGDEGISVSNANVDGDSAEELVLSMTDGAGRPTALIYDVQAPNQLRRIGDLRFPANITNFSVSTANVDGDAADELVLSMNDGAGRPTALIYDVQGPNQLRRIGDLRFPTDITNFSVATANVDSDAADELLLTLNDGAGRPTALIYDVQAPNQLRRIGDLRFPTNISELFCCYRERRFGRDRRTTVVVE